MPTNVKMPQLGESVVEGVVARWLKAPGEPVAKREPLLEITTDKIDTEVPAPAEGVLLAILVPAGATVSAGTVLATIGQPGEAPPTPAVAESSAAVQAPTPTLGLPEASTDAVRPTGRAFVSPVVARMAAEHNLDLERIEGSGLGGRITKRDVEAYLRRSEAAPAWPPTPDMTPAVALPSGRSGAEADELLTPLSAVRRTIAQHMVMSKRTSPHVTSFCEVDATAVVRHREHHRGPFAEAGVALTFTPYFLMAVVAGLKALPEANGRFTDDGIVIYRRIHIGVAVAVPNGLIVPVLRDVDEKNLQGLARAVNDISARARAGQLQPEEVQGGTFTLTNHGTGGSLFATPIINQPQTGILGVGAIVKRPVVRSSVATLLPSADDAIVIRPMVYLSFAFDHRVLDGAQADIFLQAVKHKLENWE